MARAVHVVEDLEVLAVLGHPLRVRILEPLREPASAATVARACRPAPARRSTTT